MKQSPSMTSLSPEALQELRAALIEDFGKYGEAYPEEHLQALGDFLLAIHYLRP